MASYSFLSTWCVAAPLERVWELLGDAERYPDWWKGVKQVDVLEPGADGGRGLGTLYRMRWRSRLPYSLVFDSRITRFEPPYLVEGQASGELAGFGAWRLYESPVGTAAVYSWDVRTTAAWMNWLAPIARPAFAYNHDLVMRQGAEGLARTLGAELIAHD
ncbi:MAG: hypothetical protein QOI73_546 [Solirubrobacteraceae bacterium]|jgi:hypothetical protein|nr:hypothetical protein [Solirubrobacteraceae bacterium]